jgi:hypothetical protein
MCAYSTRKEAVMERFFLVLLSNDDLHPTLEVLLGADSEGPPLASSFGTCNTLGEVLSAMAAPDPADAIVISEASPEVMRPFLDTLRHTAPSVPLVVFSEKSPDPLDPFLAAIPPSEIRARLRSTLERMLQPRPAAS